MAEPYTQLMTRLTSLGGTEETTAGTAATVTAPLASTLLYDIKLDVLDVFADNERLPQGLYFGETDAMAGKLVGHLTFKQELRPSDKFLPMLTGCGFKNTAGTYNVTSDMSARKCWSFSGWLNGKRRGISGAAGKFKLTGKNGGRVFVEWDWMGVYIPEFDEAMPAQAPINNPSFINASVGLTVAGAAAPPIASYEIDSGGSVKEREDITHAGSILHFYQEEIKPYVTIDPEARLIAQNDQYGLMLASTPAALSMTFGSSSGGQLVVTAPRMQRRLITDQDRGGKRTNQIKLSCNMTSGDDLLTFAAA